MASSGTEGGERYAGRSGGSFNYDFAGGCLGDYGLDGSLDCIGGGGICVRLV